jgi:hypothetical protein
MQLTEISNKPSMKKFVIREAETLKTTRAALYCSTCCAGR